MVLLSLRNFRRHTKFSLGDHARTLDLFSEKFKKELQERRGKYIGEIFVISHVFLLYVLYGYVEEKKFPLGWQSFHREDKEEKAKNPIFKRKNLKKEL